MAMEMSSESAVCFRCGMKYGRRKGNFPVSYAALHKGVGYAPICRDCIDAMYNTYLAQCKDAKMAVRQMCRKLDLFWSESVFETVMSKNTTRTVMTQYMAKINSVTFAGKSYDDSLSSEGTLWSFGKAPAMGQIAQTDASGPDGQAGDGQDDLSITEDVVAFWGSGYAPATYLELEKRFQYWKGRLPDGFEVDIGTEALLRQICSLELDINRDRAAGKPVDKTTNLLNTYIGSLNLKPSQRKDGADGNMETTPFGVWIRRWESQRPIPEPDPELKDVDGLIRYIHIWFFGHLCKMLGIQNSFCKLYEEEIAKRRVDKPEYNDEDDDAFLTDLLGETPDKEGDEEDDEQI